eukprot:765974-Hanusia_phi.AAC.3
MNRRVRPGYGRPGRTCRARDSALEQTDRGHVSERGQAGATLTRPPLSPCTAALPDREPNNWA